MAFAPANPLSGVMLNDMYQLTMAYAYWKAGKQFVGRPMMLARLTVMHISTRPPTC